MKDASVISFSIFKGGTGKTTSAVNIAAGLAQAGRRVLLVDLDQQASATRHLGLDPEPLSPNFYDVFVRNVPVSLVRLQTNFGFDLVPGHPLLAAVEEALEPGDEKLLREFLAGIVPDYDFVLLDSPPGKAMLAVSALTAARHVIIPLQAQRPALDGTADILRFIQDVVWKDYNPELRIMGVLPTMVRRLGGHSAGVVQKARELWGDKVFPLEVPETVVFPRSFDEGQPAVILYPKHEAIRPYLELAKLIHAKT
ncbi:MAG: ParA family protein [Candidatus Marsarchaeota archaeon]|nr:ParA family protein [Candidatus Marsarchaeota archaeon]